MKNTNKVRNLEIQNALSFNYLNDKINGKNHFAQKIKNNEKKIDKYIKYNLVRLDNLHKLKIIKFKRIWQINKNFSVLNKYYYLYYFIKNDSPENLKQLLCQFCGDIINQPVKCSNCSKIFCSDCATDTDLCPIDYKMKIDENKIKLRNLNDEEENFFGNFIVFCVNRRYGCTCEFKFKNYEKHYSSCDYIFNKFIYFSNGVFNININSYILDEIKKICLLIQCMKCLDYFDVLEINNHFSKKCVKKQIKKNLNVISIDDDDEELEEVDKIVDKHYNHEDYEKIVNIKLNKIFIKLRKEKIENELMKNNVNENVIANGKIVEKSGK